MWVDVVTYLACVAGVEMGIGGGERKREGDWGERGRGACYKNPLFVDFCGRWRLQIPDWLSRNE